MRQPISTAEAGRVVPADDPEALLNAALELRNTPDIAAALGANGRRYCQTVLNEETAIEKFAGMLQEVTRIGDRDSSSVPAR